jgi:putative nucleotidyltransferase with HDIG domain
VKAFDSPEWRAASDALLEANGVTVNAMDFAGSGMFAEGMRCGYCSLVTDVDSPSPTACFDNCPEPGTGVTRVVCRAGLPTLIAPVLYGEREIAHLVLGGFVTSTRDRRRIYEALLARSSSSETARLSMKALAVVPRRAAEGCLQMALAAATTLVATSVEQLSSAERVEELRVFVTAGQQVVASERLDAFTLGAMVEEAVALVGGEAGAVLRPVNSHLEVVALTDGWRGVVGAHVPAEGTAAGRACETGRTIVTPGGGAGTSTLALPLVLSDRVLGALEVRLPSSAMPVSQAHIARLDRFGRFISIGLQRDDEHCAMERAMAGYAQLNELAAALGAQTDIDGVARLMIRELEKAFAFQIAGFVLASYGRDQADVVLRGQVHERELENVLGDVAGRDVAIDPFREQHVATDQGSIVTDIPVREDWASLVVELSSGTIEIGYVFAARTDGGHYDAQDHALLEGLAAHAGAAFGRAALFERIRDDYAKTIAALSATLDASEHMPSGHSTRVMDYAMLIGTEIGLSFEDVEQLRFAGLLHDIGKTGVPHDILLKPSRLSVDELARVRAHAEFGASIVDQIEFLKSLTPIILHHHERWDGGGYPAGLSGEDIPLLARILAVADSFDAMSTRKAYGKRKALATACKELREAAGTQFDPRIVEAFLAGLDRMALAGGTGMLTPADSQDLPKLNS